MGAGHSKTTALLASNTAFLHTQVQSQRKRYTNTLILPSYPSPQTTATTSQPKPKTMAPRLVHLTLALGAMFLCLPGAAAIKDTVKNRMKMADRYMDENPVEEGMEAMARYVRVGLWFYWCVVGRD